MIRKTRFSLKGALIALMIFTGGSATTGNDDNLNSRPDPTT